MKCQGTYKNSLTGTGREIHIADGDMGYDYDIPEGETASDVVDAFESTYDFNLAPDEDPSTIEVTITATVYVDGEVVDTMYRVIRPITGGDVGLNA